MFDWAPEKSGAFLVLEGELVIYFTSDTHFGHKNILTYCNRPFASIEEMNEGLIQRWNDRVKPEDTVYHLGDFAMGQRPNILIRRRLNGKVILIRGNHDRSPQIMKDEAGFDEVHNNLLVSVDGLKIYMAHIPVHLPENLDERTHNPQLMTAPPSEYDYFLCGHVHQQWKRIGKTINVGCDVSDYHPLSLEELLVRDV